jgi:hypothetical protein
MAATGAIRRDPKYAGRAEMEQVEGEPFITEGHNAKGLPGYLPVRGFFNLNNDFAMP